MTALRHQRLLAALSDEERRALEGLGRPVSYQAGDVIVRQGEPSDYALAINSGIAKIFVRSPNGEEVILARRGAGELIGEMSPVDDEPRSATVAAITEVNALAIKAQEFRQYLLDYPRVLLLLLQQTNERLRESDRQKVQLATMDVASRVAASLNNWAAEPGGAVLVGFSQAELASTVGSSRQAVATVLRVLRERGIVSTRRGALVINDRPALAQMAGAQVT